MPSSLHRYQSSGSYHFITFTCYHRKPYLNDDHSRLVFEEVLEKLRAKHNFYVFGYVLMPNHVHLLLSEPKNHLLGDTMRALKTQTSRKLKQGRLQFWQRRYYDRNIITQTEFVEKLRYIHRNPVADGLVEKPEDWPWSSYRHWLTGDQSRVQIESHWTWKLREKARDGHPTSPTHRDRTAMNGPPDHHYPNLPLSLNPTPDGPCPQQTYN